MDNELIKVSGTGDTPMRRCDRCFEPEHGTASCLYVELRNEPEWPVIKGTFRFRLGDKLIKVDDEDK